MWLPVVNCARDRQCARARVFVGETHTGSRQANIDSGLALATHASERVCQLARCDEGCASHHTVCACVCVCGLNVVDTAHHRIYGVKHTTCTRRHPLSTPNLWCWLSGVLIRSTEIICEYNIKKWNLTNACDTTDSIGFLIFILSSGQFLRITAKP